MKLVIYMECSNNDRSQDPTIPKKEGLFLGGDSDQMFKVKF